MIELRLPSLGSDMDQGKLLQWLVKPGDPVKKGQVVAIVDTAKAAIDVECWHDGLVHALLTPLDATIPTGSLMAVLRSPGESEEAVNRQMAALAVPDASTVVAPDLALAAPAVIQAKNETTRLKITPAARRLAASRGINPSTLQAGADGVVSLAEVEAASGRNAAGMPATPKASRAPAMRKVIASAMVRSKREIPHYYLSEDIPFQRASEWLARQNQELAVTQRLLPAAMLLKAVGVALLRYPEFNGFWKDDSFEAGIGVHIGVAISLREGGLVAPALHDLPNHDIATLTRKLLDLVKRCRAGTLRSSELSDATLTVTNLGDQGVGNVFGVIYPPQVALVGFGRITERAWATDDGLRALPCLSASLAADHRCSDGHRGALLLASIRELLQEPQKLDSIV